jgi:signal transduction histidine kinase
MVKSQIMSLGGTIQVQSEVGKGTTFIITLKKNGTSVKAMAKLKQY